MRTFRLGHALQTFTAAALMLAATACVPSTVTVAAATPASAMASGGPEDGRTVTTVTVPIEVAAASAAPAEPLPLPVPPLAFAPAPRSEAQVVVLVYHLFGGIQSDQAVAAEAFEQQLGWLEAHGVPIIGTSDLLGFLDGTRELPARSAVIQIDDSHRSVRETAFPILARHEARFTLALNTEAIEGLRPEAVTWVEVREMIGSGLCEIASHSHIHGHMERLTDERDAEEATLSRAILEENTGLRPEAFVYPFGGNDARVQRIIAGAGYRAAFAVGGGATRAGAPRFHMPRVGVGRSMTLSAFARLFGRGA